MFLLGPEEAATVHWNSCKKKKMGIKFIICVYLLFTINFTNTHFQEQSGTLAESLFCIVQTWQDKRLLKVQLQHRFLLVVKLKKKKQYKWPEVKLQQVCRTFIRKLGMHI